MRTSPAAAARVLSTSLSGRSASSGHRDGSKWPAGPWRTRTISMPGANSYGMNRATNGEVDSRHDEGTGLVSGRADAAAAVEPQLRLRAGARAGRVPLGGV